MNFLSVVLKSKIYGKFCRQFKVRQTCPAPAPPPPANFESALYSTSQHSTSFECIGVLYFQNSLKELKPCESLYNKICTSLTITCEQSLDWSVIPLHHILKTVHYIILKFVPKKSIPDVLLLAPGFGLCTTRHPSCHISNIKSVQTNTCKIVPIFQMTDIFIITNPQGLNIFLFIFRNICQKFNQI